MLTDTSIPPYRRLGKLSCAILTAALALTGSLSLIVGGCATAPPEKTALMGKLENIDVTKRELQALMYRYAYYYAGQVDLAADEIYAGTTDGDIRRSAIQWSTMSVPEMMMHCFNYEPLVAMISAWTYAILVRNFFEDGNGKGLFGPYQSQVVDVSEALEQEIAGLAHGVLSPADAETIFVRIDGWAGRHPIRNEEYVTEGYSTLLSAAMGASVAGGLGAAGSINEQLLAMADRANLMMGYMPRQVRWQTAATLSMGQAMVAEVTDSTLAALHREAGEALPPFFEFLSRERELFTDDVARERSAVLGALAGERSAVLQEIARERGEVFKEISQERTAAMQDINALTLEALHTMVLESQGAMQASIDRAFRRIVQILIVPFSGFVVFVIIVMIWVRNTTNRVLALQESRMGSGKGRG